MRLIFLVLFAVVLVACSNERKGPVACITSLDCPVGEVCGEDGFCADPATVDLAPRDEDTSVTESDTFPVDYSDASIADEGSLVEETEFSYDEAETPLSDQEVLVPDEDEPLSLCGNGTRDAGEECDDGNLSSHDACLANCLFNRCGDGARLSEEGMVLNLPFYEGSGTTAHDLSGMGNDGMLNGALWAEGRFGKALSFAGGGMVSVVEHPSLKLTVFTVAVWVKISAMPASYVGILQKDGDRIRNYGLFVAGADNPGNEGKAFFSLTSAIPEDWKGAFSQNTIVDGRWHHLMATYDGSVMRLFVDGVVHSEVQVDVVPADTNLGVIIGYGFPGEIDEVRIYNRVLAPPEIAELAAARVRFHFDEGNGNVVYDTSGNGLNGTQMGAAWVGGRWGNALSFNGAAGQVTIPHGEWLNLGATMTLSLWLKTAVIPNNWVRLLGKSDTSCANRNYGIWVEPGTGKVLFQIEAAEWLHLLSDIAVTDNQWHRIDATYDGAIARLVIDGEIRAEQAYSQIPVLSNGPLTIGGGCALSPVNGTIDEVRIYGRALAPENLPLLPLYRSELCDDGNTTDGDGCSSLCEMEPIP